MPLSYFILLFLEKSNSFWHWNWHKYGLWLLFEKLSSCMLWYYAFGRVLSLLAWLAWVCCGIEMFFMFLAWYFFCSYSIFSLIFHLLSVFFFFFFIILNLFSTLTKIALIVFLEGKNIKIYNLRFSMIFIFLFIKHEFI